MTKNFYITTPIYYVNGNPHIGHAYSNIASDVIARFKRLDGFNIMFLTGTDEHGKKIEKSSSLSGLDTQQYVDSISQKFTKLCTVLDISNNYFIRTTAPKHKKYVQNIWNKLINNNYIYIDKYSGWYSMNDEAYFSEDDLIDGKTPSGSTVEWIEESSYFFRLSLFQNRLLNFYKQNPDFINPKSRRNEILSFVESGLKDLSISRTSLNWGISVPNDPKHIIYVWLDALFSYISILDESKDFSWPADLHIIGKDIIRFHAIYWPAFLMALGLPITKKIFAHGWWTNMGKKISKSLDNSIDPYKIIKSYGLDYFRYYLLREVSFGSDGSFSECHLTERVNAELVNKIGNLIFRTISFIYKNFNKRIPTHYKLLQKDQKLLDDSYNIVSSIRKLIDNQCLKESLELIIVIANNTNIYINKESPWVLIKNNIDRVKTVLYVVSEILRVISILLQPFIPNTAKSILDYLKVPNRNFINVSYLHRIKPGIILDKPKMFFQKIDLPNNKHTFV